VLVVDDSEVNQQVAAAMLGKLGYRAEVVGNGADALAALARAPYGAVLMDCQMPEMDGFAASAELRRREGQVRHTPIIAMTAYALRGDRERCLAAGMDDYLAKPVRIGALQAALRRWLPHPAAPTTEQDDGSDSDSDLGDGDDAALVVLDPVTLQRLDQLGLDLHTVLPKFLEETRLGLAGLRDALERGDALDVASRAHRLKGAATLVGAVEMKTLAAQLEAEGHAAALTAAGPLLDALHPAFLRTREAMDAALGSAGSTSSLSHG
jgi:CheY-like chemotaxis protein/HPt (histidine-containing phosphotransfer) domain-containing protein